MDREPSLKWKDLSTVDLLALTSPDMQLFMIRLYFSFFTKQLILRRRSTVVSSPLQLGFPEMELTVHFNIQTYVASSGSIVAKQSTHNPKIQGSNPVNGIDR